MIAFRVFNAGLACQVCRLLFSPTCAKKEAHSAHRDRAESVQRALRKPDYAHAYAMFLTGRYILRRGRDKRVHTDGFFRCEGKSAKVAAGQLGYPCTSGVIVGIVGFACACWGGMADRGVCGAFMVDDRPKVTGGLRFSLMRFSCTGLVIGKNDGDT